MPETWKATAKAMLSRHFLLGQLPDSLLDDLLGHAQFRRYKRGESLFRKGDPGDALLAVILGKIRISTLSAKGQEVVLNMLGPGDVFGEIAFLDGKPRTADAAVVEDTGLLTLERKSFLPYLEENPKVAIKLLGVLCERLRWVSDSFEDIVFLELPARLAKRLLRLTENFGHQEPSGLRIDLKLSQQELGHMTGVTREAVNKVLRIWEKEGILTIERAALTIHEPESLRAILENS